MGRTHEYLPHASVSRPVETRHKEYAYERLFQTLSVCFQWEVLETAEEAVDPRVGRGISSATGHLGRILQG
jgi:hypothetical protein